MEYSKKKKEKNTIITSENIINPEISETMPNFVISDGISKQQMKRKRQSKRTTYKVSKISSRVARDVLNANCQKVINYTSG